MSDRKEALLGLITGLTRHARRRRRSWGKRPKPFACELLESRRLLAVSDMVPSIQGTVFLDTNANGSFEAGEQIVGATVRLFVDDGNGSFEPNGGDTQVGSAEITDADGQYGFDTIDHDAAYFVMQPAQTVGGVALQEQASGLIRPGTLNLIIDSFQTNQVVQATPPAPSSDSSTLSFPDETEVIGAERDMFVELVSGVGEVELVVNPFNLLDVLQFNSSSGVQGNAVLTWDGEDFEADPIPSMGLGGRDLTQGGVNTGMVMTLGIDTAGMSDVLTLLLFQGSAANVSSVSFEIPVTDGTATEFLFVPFADFDGPVSPANVDAIQLRFGIESVPSADGQVGYLGVLGPKVFDIANAGGADLAITKSNSSTTVVPGEGIEYEITVQNLGPQDVTGATIQDVFPAALNAVTYTSSTTGNVTGNTTSGSGNLNETINIAAGATVTYLVTATVDADARGTVVNTATVQPPEGVVDPDMSNNTDDESDTLTPEVDLTIHKTNNVDVVLAGGSTTYIITVTNNGPNNADGAAVIDVFPAVLTSVNYTSVANGGATGNTNGNGNIADIVNLPVGSRIVYTVQATIDPQASGQLVNQATVTAPDGLVDTDLSNNSSTDTDRIDQVFAQISGFVYLDLNDNGIRDFGERPLPGVEIVLERNDIELERTLTDGGGSYLFDALEAGTYDVIQIQPAQFRNGRLTVGGGIGQITGENQFTVPLQLGDDARELNFGELPFQPTKRSLSASNFRRG